MYFKTYESKYGLAIAVADKELIGKTLKFKDIEFFVNPRFYKGRKGTAKEIIDTMRAAVNINLIGKKAVDCGLESGMIDKENIIMIGKIPHAQSVRIIF
jgi:hypothetical protein